MSGVVEGLAGIGHPILRKTNPPTVKRWLQSPPPPGQALRAPFTAPGNSARPGLRSELRHHLGAPLSGDPHPAHHILFQYQTALVHRCESIPKFSHFCHSFQTVPAVTLTLRGAVGRSARRGSARHQFRSQSQGDPIDVARALGIASQREEASIRRHQRFIETESDRRTVRHPQINGVRRRGEGKGFV